jgi:hypothetical protein
MTLADRRIVLAGLATGLMLATRPTPAEPADPVFAAISDHAAACRVVADADCDLNMIEGFRPLEQQLPVAQASFRAPVREVETSQALAGIATTPAGLRALVAHRSDPRHRRAEAWTHAPVIDEAMSHDVG